MLVLHRVGRSFPFYFSGAHPHRQILPRKQIAVGFNANFIPQNFASFPGYGAVDDIFVFTNFNQGNVLASAPNPAGPGNTDTDYSPLWQVNLVSWVKGPPAVLTSQADITTAAQNGFVSVQRTPIIVECSVIFTPRGGLLPLATAREDSAEEGRPQISRIARIAQWRAACRRCSFSSLGGESSSPSECNCAAAAICSL
jgi:hypothetical protein